MTVRQEYFWYKVSLNQLNLYRIQFGEAVVKDGILIQLIVL